MDDHKLVTIIIFFALLKHEKDAIFYMKICLENILGFGRMHENKIFFCFFLCFLKREINLKVLRFFLNFFINISEKARYFNTEFVSYNVKIQPNIKKN
jgi:hypothetical protein